jgi:Xaa-Pro aminopeptidase
MPDLSVRLNAPISTAELERRWTALRAAMEVEGIDVLVAQSTNDHLGGYVRYFTDMPAVCGIAMTVVFPHDAEMTLITHGSFNGDMRLPPGGDGMLRGVERVLTFPYWPSIDYTQRGESEAVAVALGPYAQATIGLVNPFQLSYATGDDLKRRYPNATWVNAGDLVDRIKMIKSAEEQSAIRRTAAVQDQAMQAAFAAVEPGKRESDIAAVAQLTVQQLGGEQGLYMAGSGPGNTAAPLALRHTQARVLEEGDVFNLLIETNGPGGFYTELGRSCVIGTAPTQVVEEFNFALDARRHCLDQLVPGASCGDIWDSYNAYLRDHGRPEEARLHCHGQGYDLVERPLIRADEPLSIQRDMNITCHPIWVKDGAYAWVCDNYLIGNSGPERLHSFREELVEL